MAPAAVMIVAGVDVGGPKKGFHVVALRNGRYCDRFHTLDAAQAARWVRQTEAVAVGVDAPCRFSADGRMRTAERELSRMGIPCFATPTREKAQGHPFYAWMLHGMTLYERLCADYRLFDGSAGATGKVCFETFPQAVAVSLAGRRLSAAHKRADRKALLEAAGIATSALRPADFVDAALCALTACRLTGGSYEALGRARDGYIILPAQPLVAGLFFR